MTHTKVCPKRLTRKPLDKFKPRPDGSPGGYCYSCEIQYHRDYNAKRYATEESRAAELKRTKDRYHSTFKPDRIARKVKLIVRMGGKCQRCGYSKSAAALDFHHTNPVEKTRTVSHLLALRSAWAWLAALRESLKCELLCSNCHREETYPGWELDT